MSSPASKREPLAFSWLTLWNQFVIGLFRNIGLLGRELRQRRGRIVVAGVPMLWLGLFFLVPFLIVAKISLSDAIPGGRPPYADLLSWGEHWRLQLTLNFGNFLQLAEDSLYLAAYLNSLKIAAVSTLLALIVGYPMAYGIARAGPRARMLLLMLVILPFWTSFLIRIYAWIGLLRGNGLINQTLMALGVIDEPLRLLNTDFAIYIGIVYSYLPFMVLPLAANLMKLDRRLLEAAFDLGCRPWKAFWRITFPLSIPGVIAGCLLVFVPAVGEFVIPDLLGGADALMIGKVLWTEFFHNRNWPVASAVAMAMLMLIVIPILMFERLQDRRAEREGRG